jgi:hypothetical protein
MTIMPRRSLLDGQDPIRRVDHDDATEEQSGAVLVTDDHEVIRKWAARHGAEPATGEATRSGPATRNVQDGGTGLRFNFPGAGAFRPITWNEWLEHLTQHDLLFVYEDDVPGRPPNNKYRLVPRQTRQREVKRP